MGEVLTQLIMLNFGDGLLPGDTEGIVAAIMIMCVSLKDLQLPCDVEQGIVTAT